MTDSYFHTLQIERSEEEEGEEKGSFVQRRRTSIPPFIVDPQLQAAEELLKLAPQEGERSPSLIVAGILDELAPREEVVKYGSGANGQPPEAQSLK